MDCQNFKELLDSYLCGELAVETNHSILCHAERCGSCRSEMAARRRLRDSLRSACSREKMSEEALRNLRARLRSEAGLSEAGLEAGSGPSGNERAGRNWLAGLFKMRLLTPVLIVAALALFIGGAWSLYILRRGDADNRRLSSEQIKTLELSVSVLAESASDHRTCAAHVGEVDEVDQIGSAEMPDSVRKYDPACAGLDKIVAEGAAGVRLRAAHLCGYGERTFAHMIYIRDGKLISLLVTGRDSRALKSGKVPPFDGLGLGLQRFTRGAIALGAYQTGKRIVLVVSDLPENENAALAEILAKPVVEHLRGAEAGAGLEERIGLLRGRENEFDQFKAGGSEPRFQAAEFFKPAAR